VGVPLAARAAEPTVRGRAAARLTATSGGERITDYTIAMTVLVDGSLRVREDLTYSFGTSSGRHGIDRTLPVQFSYDEEHTRVYPLAGDPRASSPSGAPAQLETTYGPTVTMRIGDPDRTVRGTQRYVLEYDLGGVVNTLPDGQELYWNAIGTEWKVPIDRVRVTVDGPAGVTKATCFKGVRAGTEQCEHAIKDKDTATYTAAGLDAGEGLTVVAAFPSGTCPDAAPILERIWTPQRAFRLTPASGAGALGLLLVIGGGAVYLVLRTGRDRRYLGFIPGLAPAEGPGPASRRALKRATEEQDTYERRGWVGRVPLMRSDPIAVQFQPPKGMRPGQLGTLLDEYANVVDVTATIIDLAVRGFLQITEVRRKGWFHGGDWRLTRSRRPPGGELERYESTLLEAMFNGRGEVLLSGLRQTFRTDLLKVQSQLYDDVTGRGWFRGNPVMVRRRWRGLAVAVMALGCVLTWLLARYTTFGLVGVGAVLGGAAALALAGRMPSRTAAGTAMLAQARGFRLYLETAEANEIRFEEEHDVFSRYLPYAIVFGVAERWARVFADLAASGVTVASPTWYVSDQSYGAPDAFDFGGFGHAMGSFVTTTSGSIAAATPSSSGGSGFSGGFSGGGGGGGGGGSW
jgi:uncharacterized membrane protein YgcG